jgi:hypothetical protein
MEYSESIDHAECTACSAANSRKMPTLTQVRAEFLTFSIYDTHLDFSVVFLEGEQHETLV